MSIYIKNIDNSRHALKSPITLKSSICRLYRNSKKRMAMIIFQAVFALKQKTFTHYKEYFDQNIYP